MADPTFREVKYSAHNRVSSGTDRFGKIMTENVSGSGRSPGMNWMMGERVGCLVSQMAASRNHFCKRIPDNEIPCEASGLD